MTRTIRSCLLKVIAVHQDPCVRGQEGLDKVFKYCASKLNVTSISNMFLLSLLALRKFWIRRRRPETEKASMSRTTSEGFHSQEEDTQKRHIAVTLASQYNETEMIVNQLAALAASVSHASSNNSTRSTSSPNIGPKSESHIASLRSQHEQPEEEEEEESFYHLRSLITVSCLPQHTSGHTPALSVSTLGSKSGRHSSQVFDGNRASSILSLHCGDLPNLPFPSKREVPEMACPRYSPLPPPYVQRKLSVRPEVRF